MQPNFSIFKTHKSSLGFEYILYENIPTVKRAVLPFLVMVYRIKTFFKLVETPPVMGSLKLSLVPHSVREGRQFVVNSIMVLV